MAHALSVFVDRHRSGQAEQLQPTGAVNKPSIIRHQSLPTHKTQRPDDIPVVDNKPSPASHLSTDPSTNETTINKSRSDDPDPSDSKTSNPYVLLVDDNPINLNILVMYMRRIGCDYAMANNGQEAVDAFTGTSRAFNYVLMDISMPVMDGFSATRAISNFEHENGKEPVTVVALTGLGDMDARKEANASGVNLFWAKPVPMQ